MVFTSASISLSALLLCGTHVDAYRQLPTMVPGTHRRMPLSTAYRSTRTAHTSLNALRKPSSAAAPPSRPSGAELRAFYLPALGLWIGGPILSLIDTSAVGLSAAAGAGAAQLGSLGPATTFCDGATYTFAFLNVATTNLYAAASARVEAATDDESRAEAADEAEAVVRRAAKVAGACGAFVVVLLAVATAPLLRMYVGHGSSAVVAPAAAYVRIRALSLPAAMLGGVIQSALLGAKDSLTPLLATAVASVANLFGDLLCVVGLRMGVEGAAIATSIASLLGTATLLRSARTTLVPKGGLALWPSRGKSSVRTVPTRQFLAYAAPVLTLILGKIACFGFMTHVAASLGETPLAAHQIVLTLFFFLSPFLEVVSQTAQAFLPRYEPQVQPADADAAEWREASDGLAARLLRIATVIAALCSAVAAIVPLCACGLLTNDAAVAAAVRPLALPFALAVALTGPVTAGEGALLARRQLGYLASVYVASTAVLPYVLLRLKRTSGPVSAVWATFAVFQLFRAIAFTGRIWCPVLWTRLRRQRQPADPKTGRDGKE